jgi:hypothetical protein
MRREIVAKIEAYIISPFLNITTEGRNLLDHRVDGSHLKSGHKLEAGFITTKRGVHGMSTLSQSIFDLAKERKEFGRGGSQVVSIRVDELTISHLRWSGGFGGQLINCHTTP